MKSAADLWVVGGLLIAATDVSQARVRAWITINPFPIVGAAPAPVVVAQPVVADPYAPPPVDYHQVLSDFHARVERLRRVLDRQLNRRIITAKGTYDKHADDLDAIIQEEQQDAARQNGALTPR